MKTTLDYKLAWPLFRYGMLPFALALFAILGQMTAPNFYQQGLDLIRSFFLYALLAQLTHLSWTHLALNLLGLCIITWGFSRWCSPKQQALSLLWAWLWVAFYLTEIEPLAWYCGLSGALHASFSTQLVWAWKRRQPQHIWPFVLLGLGLIVKLVFEGLSDDSIMNTNIGGPIAFAAHRGGALGGLLLGLLFTPRPSQQSTHQQQAQ